jgi:hypothetical protein
MSAATRERKLAFMREIDTFALRNAVEAAFVRNGPDWLTNEQLDEIVSHQVRRQRWTQRHNRENRKLRAAQ